MDGLVLMLKNNEIDFGISSLVMNRRRQLVTDYTSSATWDFRYLLHYSALLLDLLQLPHVPLAMFEAR